MARAPDEEIRRLKVEVPLEGLVAASGVELRKAGADLVGRCPFHDDHEPSLVVSPAKNLWHCLGACQAGGSGYRLGDARRRASASATPSSCSAPVPPAAPWTAPSRRGPPPASSPRRSTARPATPSCSPRWWLTITRRSASPPRRSPTSGLAPGRLPRADRDVPLGYANRTLGYRLAQKTPKVGAEHARPPAGTRGAAGQRPRALQRLGRGPGVRRGRDGSPRCTGARCETTCGRARRRTSTCPGLTAACGTAPASPVPDEVVLAESLIDGLSFWCAGYRNVTAVYGTEGFTDELAEALCTGTKRGARSPSTATRPATGRPGVSARCSWPGASSAPGSSSPPVPTPTTWPVPPTTPHRARPLPAQSRLDGQGDGAAKPLFGT